MTIAPGVRLGPYEVVAKLGEGGMGEVYRATDSRLRRDVAIKALPREFAADAERLRRFEQEARAASALSHPNILTVFDLGTHEGQPFLVTELLQGRSLREVLVSGETIAPRRALDWGAQIARGLAAAHDKGIVHRDLKPENLFLTLDGVAKILDFGLAKLSLSEGAPIANATTLADGTGSGVILGTVGYMAPEQVRGERVDARADLFALGCVLYELLGGGRAFRRDSAIETLNAILKEEPPPLAEVRSDLPAGVARAVERCLAKLPAERWQSSRDLAFRLSELLEPGSAAMGRPGAGPLEEKERSRPRRPWAWAAGVFALLLAGVLARQAITARPAPSPPLWQRVTFRRGTPTSGRFAPDGKTILYSDRLEGQPERVFSTRTDSPESSVLSFPPASVYAISSTGQVALGVFHQDSETLAVGSLAGGAVRELLEGVTAADWSPDGSRLAVIHRLADRSVLELPVGTPLYDPGAGRRVSLVRFLSSGDRLAMVEYRHLAGDFVESSIITVDLQGKRTVLSAGWEWIMGLAWNSATNEVWFSGRELGNVGGLVLHAVSLTGRQRLVQSVPGLVRIQDFAPDGRTLLLHSLWPDTLICRAPGSAHEADLSWLDFSDAVDLSDDGRTVLIEESGIAGGGAGAIYLRGTDGGDAVRLGDGSALELSRDGKWVLARRTKASNDYVLLPTGPGVARPVAPPGLEILNARFLSAERLLLRAREHDGPARHYVYDVEQRAAHPMSAENFLALAIAPGGRTGLFSGPQGAFEMALDGSGTIRQAPTLGPGEVALRYSSDGKSILVGRDAADYEVSRVDLATGRRDLLYRIEPHLGVDSEGMRSVILSGDGSSYCYSYMRDISDLYSVSGLR